AEVPVTTPLREQFLVRFGGNRLCGRLLADFYTERGLGHLGGVHPNCIVGGQRRANLATDVANTAFLKPGLPRLYAAARDRARPKILDALHGAEFGAFSAWKAQIDVHERDFARALLLAPHVFGCFRDAIFLEAALDDIDGAHESISHPGSASGQAGI